MAKRAVARKPAPPAPPATFPFKATKPKGAQLAEESELYSTEQVDPVSGRRILQGARAAANTRMHASATARRRRRAREADEAAEDDLDGLGEGIDSEDDPPEEEDIRDEPEDDPEFEIPPPAALPEPAAPPLSPAQVFQRINEQPVLDPPAATRPAPGLNVRSVGIDDADRLWDWVRLDGDRGQSFFGQPLANSLDLHALLAQHTLRERDGTALVRAVYYEGGTRGDVHVGFLALSPIMPTEHVAAVRVYLQPEVRGKLGGLMAALVALALQIVPEYKLVLLTDDQAQMRLYRQVLAPLGFAEHAVFVR